MRENFIKTFDKTTSEKLLSLGFQKVDESNGIYTFLNNKTLLFSNDVDESKILYSNVLTLNASHGLLLWPLLKRTPEGLSIAQVNKSEEKEIIEHFTEELDLLSRPLVIVSSPSDIFDEIEEGTRFRVISGRNVLTHFSSAPSLIERMKSFLEAEGEIALMEAIPSLSSRLSDFAEESAKAPLIMAEKEIYKGEIASWGKAELEDLVNKELPGSEIIYIEVKEERLLKRDNLLTWYKNSYLCSALDEDKFIALFENKTVEWKNVVALIRYGFKAYEEAKEDKTWKEVHEKTSI